MNKIPLVLVYTDSFIQIAIKNKILKQILIIRPIYFMFHRWYIECDKKNKT